MKNVVRISALVAVVAATVAVGAPSASAGVAGQCPEACTMLYAPVVCQLSDGSTQEFGNECEAQRYACDHGVQILSCGRV